MTPKFITVHDTANTRSGADAEAHARYLKGSAANVKGVSWHFTVDGGTLNGKVAPAIYQHLPLTENGWHAGDGRNGIGNRQSIGIEICENSDGNRVRAEDAAAWLTAKLLTDFGLDLSAVKQHHDWSRKNCPRVLRGRTGGWTVFLSAVSGYTIPVVYETGYVVQRGDTLTSIAAAHGVTLQQLVAANRHITTPNLITPGQMIFIPGTAKQATTVIASREHVVRRGDTLSEIAEQFNTTVTELMRLNPQITDRNRITVGNVIRLPAAVTPPIPPAPIPLPITPPVIVPAPPQPRKLFRVQAGAFRNRTSAEALAARLKAAGFNAIIREEVES